MSELFHLTEDQAGTVKVDEISFDPIPIGEKAQKSVYIQNQASDELTVDSVESFTEGPGEIRVADSPNTVMGKGTSEIIFEAAPISAGQLRGLKAEIEIKAKAILQP